MADLTGMRLGVAGAGAFGLSVALRAASAGAAVEVWDPAPLGDNASGVAAGMIAPVGEALFDRHINPDLPLFRAGRDGWESLCKLAPQLRIDRSGGLFRFPDAAALLAAEERLAVMGAEARQTPGQPHGLFTPEDWRIDPSLALPALKSAVVAMGGIFRADALLPSQMDRFDAVVLAAGIESKAFASLAPELSILQPIKGQIVRFTGGPMSGPAIRTSEVYVAPQPSGALAGATMEAGRSDRTVDAETIEAIRARALRVMPELEPLAYSGAAGVRAGAPDGFPLVGPSSRPGLFLATGARRNGWLMAPLVSEILVSYLGGGDGGRFASALDPRRAFAP